MVPRGYCQCGCGRKTAISKQNNVRHGWVKGEPRRFVKGHHARSSPTDFTEDPETNCWLWDLTLNRGYGLMWRDGKTRSAHRTYYEDLVGPIPADLQIDHLCRNPSCVNPGHMEPVTGRVNTLRGDTVSARNAAKTHCIHGHPFSGDNLYIYPSGRRGCRSCFREKMRKRRKSVLRASA